MHLRFFQFMLSKFRLDLKARNVALFCVVFSYFVFQIWLHPKIFLEGRFFAEEGSIWWANTLNSSIIQQIFFVPLMTGYFCGITNFVVLIGNLLPINIAPLATSWVSFIIQLQVCVIYWHYSSKSHFKNRILMLCIFLYSPIFFISETFANSINSQTFLGLIAAIFLFYWQDPAGRFFKAYLYIVLLFSFLSGWYGVILTPLYLIRLMFEKRSTYKKIIVLSISLCFILQFLVYGYQKNHNLLWPEKNSLNFTLDSVTSDAFSLFKGLFWMYSDDLNFAHYLAGSFILVIMFLSIKNIRQSERKMLSNYFYFLGAFILEYFLILAGDATPAPGLHGRYLVVLVGLIFFGILNFITDFIDVKFAFLILFFIFTVRLLVLGTELSEYKKDSYVNCSDKCLSWQENVAGVQNGSFFAYYFWPQNIGEPDWAISSRNPRIRLAPFQALVMGVPKEIIIPLE